MQHENVFAFALGEEVLGLSLLHAFAAAELCGVLATGILLILMRARVGPGALIMFMAFIQVVA